MDSLPVTIDLPSVTGAHHAAFRCRNAEETREFYENLLGFPLVQALDISEHPTTGEDLRYMHIFFDIGGNGSGGSNFIAFFEVIDGAGKTSTFNFKRQWGMDLHFAMGLEDHTALAVWQEYLSKNGIAVEGPIDHGIFSSIYFHDPNGYRLEFSAQDSPQVVCFLEDGKRSHAVLRNWVNTT